MNEDDKQPRNTKDLDATASADESSAASPSASSDPGLQNTSFIRPANVYSSASVSVLMAKQAIDSSADELDIPAEDTIHVSKPKLYGSIFFWMPVLIAIAITILINLAIRSYFEGRTDQMIYWAIVFLGILGLCIFYHIMRGRKIKEQQAHTRTEYLEHHDKLRTATVDFLDNAGDNIEKATTAVEQTGLDEVKPEVKKDPKAMHELEETTEDLEELTETIDKESDLIADNDETFEEAEQDIEEEIEKLDEDEDDKESKTGSPKISQFKRKR